MPVVPGGDVHHSHEAYESIIADCFRSLGSLHREALDLEDILEKEHSVHVLQAVTKAHESYHPRDHADSVESCRKKPRKAKWMADNMEKMGATKWLDSCK